MRRLALVVVAGMSLCATIASAGDAEVFDFNKEIAKANPQAGAGNRFMIRTGEYTVSAVVVRDEIPTHDHKDGNHVLYIVSGQGKAIVAGKPIPLKPGVLIHIPQGIVHSIKAERGKITFVDFVQHAFDPNQAGGNR